MLRGRRHVAFHDTARGPHERWARHVRPSARPARRSVVDRRRDRCRERGALRPARERVLARRKALGALGRAHRRAVLHPLDRRLRRDPDRARGALLRAAQSVRDRVSRGGRARRVRRDLPAARVFDRAHDRRDPRARPESRRLPHRAFVGFAHRPVDAARVGSPLGARRERSRLRSRGGHRRSDHAAAPRSTTTRRTSWAR